jgi:hypothetical protein
MPLVGEERREFQRIPLDPPVSGRLSETPVNIIEIGILGARVHHYRGIAQQYGDLTFTFADNDLVLKSEIVRTSDHEGGFSSGIRFLAAVGESGDQLRDMLGQLVAHEFEVRRKMPANTIPQGAVDGDRTVRGKDAAFLCYRLEGKVWRKRRVFLPEQPNSGFTVARSQDSDEIQRLCQVYEAADEEGRRLIRLFAELSVSDALEIPPKV